MAGTSGEGFTVTTAAVATDTAGTSTSIILDGFQRSANARLISVRAFTYWSKSTICESSLTSSHASSDYLPSHPVKLPRDSRGPSNRVA